MPERFVLGLPDNRDQPLDPDERAIRALVRGMNDQIDAEVTPELVQSLAAVVLAWPSVEGTERP